MSGDDTTPVNADRGTAAPVQEKPTDAELAVYQHLSDLFATQIKTQKVNLVISSAFFLLAWVAGVIGTLYLNRSEGLTVLLRLAPAGLSTVALPLPLRSYLKYRIRIPIYVGYKRFFDEALATKTSVEPWVIEDARAALKPLQEID
ncbi:MAG TPA: hypothetical protein VNG71_19255 [Pyrinomonadaceae bacterium]|nr:hypothetical protein [Pyrinomonadaceae bacterium]